MDKYLLQKFWLKENLRQANIIGWLKLARGKGVLSHGSLLMIESLEERQREKEIVVQKETFVLGVQLP